jgi:hypothetical protein
MRHNKRKIKDFGKCIAEESKNYEYFIHPNIKYAVCEILDSMFKYRHNMLTAQMQSGKSATFNTVIYVLNNNEEVRNYFGITKDNTYIITGMSDRELSEQLIKDACNYQGAHKPANNVFNNAKMRNIINNQDTEENKKLIRKMSRNSFFVIEESAFASNTNSKLDAFFKMLGIEPNGNTSILNKRNVYILSVSATPMAESINAFKDNNKGRIILKTGNNYYGIKQMFENNKVIQAYDLNTAEGIKKLTKTVKAKYTQPGYILIRVSSNMVMDKVKKSLGKNYDYIDYHGNRKNELKIDEILKFKPLKPTVIFLKGMLRAGKRICDSKHKNNILMVHDTYDSKTDTVVQSLLGRLCGYKSHNVDIFCDKDSADAYRVWVLENFTPAFIPTSAKNVKKPKESKSTGKYVSKFEFAHELSILLETPRKIYNFITTKNYAGKKPTGKINHDSENQLTIVDDLLKAFPDNKRLVKVLNAYKEGNALIGSIYKPGLMKESSDTTHYKNFVNEVKNLEAGRLSVMNYHGMVGEAKGKYKLLFILNCKKGDARYGQLLIIITKATGLKSESDTFKLYTNEKTDMYHRDNRIRPEDVSKHIVGVNQLNRQQIRI